MVHSKSVFTRQVATASGSVVQLNERLVTVRVKHFQSSRDVLFTNQDIEIANIAKRQIPICQLCQNGAFVRNGWNVTFFEKAEDSEQFPRPKQISPHPVLEILPQLIQNVLGHREVADGVEISR